MSSTSSTEEALVDNLRTHQSADFSRLYAAYAPALYGVLLRLVKDPARAEDLLQDAFIKIWLNRQHYDPAQGRLFTWLLTITRNVALDELRTKKKQLKASGYGYHQSDSVVLPTLIEGPLKGSLVSSLAPIYRAVVELMYYKGLTSQEAATHLKLPLGTVKTRARTALQQLKAQFRQDIQHYQVGTTSRSIQVCIPK
ncbi:RNA polymerase sigma factor [Spirosoma pollinicola]|uniref:RNA polymerase sigma factor n=1 Tax=Spirosoma pollinicola TaxID=2057025 RepID=A0A2K8ZAE4_9BACT|nr:sigma-70 family RNA polymerase sigma factor [Spirosoma pollinicola]AUD06848.1 RNA polymerase subunit sigma-70 [Spirosoma pollinicola]